MFSQVSVCPQGGVRLWVQRRYLPLGLGRGVHTPLWHPPDTHSPLDTHTLDIHIPLHIHSPRSTSERYASYWNAFLLKNIKTNSWLDLHRQIGIIYSRCPLITQLIILCVFILQGDIGLNVAQMIVELIRDNRKIVDRITRQQIDEFINLLRSNKVYISNEFHCNCCTYLSRSSKY